MPFRERVRRVLNRHSHSSTSTSSSSKSNSSSSSHLNLDPDIYYQPGEKMPPLKYRRPVAKAHKEKLEAFSFATAWRRKSVHSIYSPMGSRMPSRKNSVVSCAGAPSERRSLSISMKSGSDVRREHHHHQRHQQYGGERNLLVRETSDDETDIANVGLSRRQTREDSNEPKPTKSNDKSTTTTAASNRKTDLSRPPTNELAANGDPEGRLFTSQDLSLALARSRISS